MNNTNILGRREIIAHDADGLKNFWERKIEKQTVDHQHENARKSKSALSKLREEWTQRLDCRLKMLHSFQEEQRRYLYASPTESFQSNANTAA
ncbi:protein FAM240B-like [Bombina bombina]|uniref:protein FAM240B-like n=1 Tax=Bombina bombina TaxID=8345 RepID=UPI00235A532D|nr:protein FAM240B-like [Bombina bombina]